VEEKKKEVVDVGSRLKPHKVEARGNEVGSKVTQSFKKRAVI
jgi:hypothetical protein